MTRRAARPTLPTLSAFPAALLALALAVGLGVGMLLAAPAQAHDTLVKADPADGSTLDTAPTAITLTYSANILHVSPVVRVTDEAGTVVIQQAPRIEGPNAILDLPDGLPKGTNTVQWRVVSSDGHPIEGTFTFTVTNGPEPGQGGGSAGEQPVKPGSEGSGNGSAGDGAAGSGSEGGEKGTRPSAAPGESSEGADDGGGSPMLWLLGGIGLIAVIAVVAALTLSRKPE